MKVPVSRPDITGEDVHSVQLVTRSGWISGVAPIVREFEAQFAKYVGVEDALVTGSGTTALHLALATLGIGKGDEVIMPTFTMIASANAVHYLGAKPVFVDSDPETWCMDVEEAKERITPKTRAIMPVHVYGHPCDMDPIMDLSDDYDLLVVEDAAEAHGAEYRKRMVGSIGDAGCFSLYANKIITTGEGGIITFSLPSDWVNANWLRAHCFGRHGKHYWHDDVGYGYRMSGLQAALGVSQLKRIKKYVEWRRESARLYMERLKPLADDDLITFPVEKPWAKNVYWMFSFLVNPLFPLDRDGLVEALAERNVESRTFFFIHEIALSGQEVGTSTME